MLSREACQPSRSTMRCTCDAPWLPHLDPAAQRSWAEDWAAVLASNEADSCAQSGERGPPFAAAPPPTASFIHAWLPWNWYSLDGTGWCYDEEWDELELCERMTDRVIDWGGTSHGPAPARPLHSPLALVLAVCGTALLALRAARREWETRERACELSDTGRERGSWLAFAHSGDAWPWRWLPAARHEALLCAAALALGLWLPLPDGVLGPGADTEPMDLQQWVGSDPPGEMRGEPWQ